MGAPKGNQFWKLRSEHGREKLFKSPELLWQAATQYFNWCDGHPWYTVEGIKSGDMAGKLMKIPTAIPYTITGFLLYAHANEAYWRQFKQAGHEDFSTVIEEIESIIYTQKYTGAAVGAFNANIIARDLGLKETIDHTTKGEKINGFDLSKYTDEELSIIAELQRKGRAGEAESN